MKKKPFTINCPGTLIALQHDGDEISKNLPELLKYFRAGKRLFIEFAQVPYSYICRTALQHGMKEIVSLDRGKVEKPAYALQDRAIFHIRPEEKKILDKTTMSNESYLRTLDFYGMGPLRERKWALKLRQAKEGDVIVLNPQHAYRIAPLLGISRKKVVWLTPPDMERLKSYRIALTARKRRIVKEARKALRKQRIRERKTKK